MMQEPKKFTESALADKIKESWRMSKTTDFPRPGGYYYNEIDNGILFGKIIEIPLTTLNKELRETLNVEKKEKIQRAIFRAIKEIAQEKFGSRELTDRIKWRFV